MATSVSLEPVAVFEFVLFGGILRNCATQSTSLALVCAGVGRGGAGVQSAQTLACGAE